MLRPGHKETAGCTPLRLAMISDRHGRIHWTDRVTWERDGHVRPLSFHWPDGGPLWVRSSIRAFQLISSPVVLPMIGAALDTVEGVRQS